MTRVWHYSDHSWNFLNRGPKMMSFWRQVSDTFLTRFGHFAEVCQLDPKWCHFSDTFLTLFLTSFVAFLLLLLMFCLVSAPNSKVTQQFPSTFACLLCKWGDCWIKSFKWQRWAMWSLNSAIFENVSCSQWKWCSGLQLTPSSAIDFRFVCQFLIYI